ncbi:MAG: hypothetical protein WKF96_25370 [Solirubrobacteraceae bacterium]
MKRFLIAVSAGVAVAAGVSALLVLPANGTPAPSNDDTVAAAQEAFPALKDTAGGATPRLPTVASSATVVKRGLVGDGTGIYVTREGEFCMTVGRSGGCTTTRLAVDAGYVAAATDCSGSGPVATVTGVVPKGVTRVQALGPVAVSATAGADGSVSLTIPGGVMHGLELSNGKVSPLELGNDCDRPGAPAGQASPVG